MNFIMEAFHYINCSSSGQVIIHDIGLCMWLEIKLCFTCSHTRLNLSLPLQLIYSTILVHLYSCPFLLTPLPHDMTFLHCLYAFCPCCQTTSNITTFLQNVSQIYMLRVLFVSVNIYHIGMHICI